MGVIPHLIARLRLTAMDVSMAQVRHGGGKKGGAKRFGLSA
jgi:hypothetical protein